jgi:hypothetical protein
MLLHYLTQKYGFNLTRSNIIDLYTHHHLIITRDIVKDGYNLGQHDIGLRYRIAVRNDQQ